MHGNMISFKENTFEGYQKIPQKWISDRNSSNNGRRGFLYLAFERGFNLASNSTPTIPLGGLVPPQWHQTRFSVFLKKP